MLKQKLTTEELSRLFRFFCVGVGATAVHAGVLYAGIKILGLPQAVSNVAAFLSANVVSYFLHSLHTFRAALGLRPYIKFTAAGIAGLLTVVCIGLAGDIWHFDFKITLVATVFAVPIVSYAIMRNWVFSGDNKK